MNEPINPFVVWAQTYWWLPWVTTVVFPWLQREFSKYVNAFEMPEKTDTRRYRFWFRILNIAAGNPKRVEALDELMKEWRKP